MCLEVVNLSDWERVGESLGNQKLQTSLASKGMGRSAPLGDRASPPRAAPPLWRDPQCRPCTLSPSRPEAPAGDGGRGGGGGGVCLEPPRARHQTSPLGSAKARHAGAPPTPRPPRQFRGAGQRPGPGRGPRDLRRQGAGGARGRGARAGGGAKAEERRRGGEAAARGGVGGRELGGVWEEEELEVGAAAQQGPGPLNLDGPAWELEAGSAQADRAYLRLQRRFGRIRRLHLAPRSFVVQNIPGFWVTAFLNHPQLLAMIITRDEDMLCHLIHLEVRELRNARAQCKFKFRFWNNPYFRNKVLMKEYECRSLGPVVSVGTRIRGTRARNAPFWYTGTLSAASSPGSRQHSLPEADKVAQILRRTCGPNPCSTTCWRIGPTEPGEAWQGGPQRPLLGSTSSSLAKSLARTWPLHKTPFYLCLGQ
ncbi:hypothetical protein GH733_010093 [Mirounga leonina]|nr:hypothetical protein GH733_010093 [Mirounga leonina]